jgi:hypothetical protein
MTRRKPRVNTNPGANQYAAPGERIIEYTMPDGTGGLISFWTSDTGKTHVHLYRADPGIVITVSEVAGEPRQGRCTVQVETGELR